MKSEQELKDIATGIFKNEIFTSNQVEHINMLPSVFMLLVAMNKKQVKELAKKEPVLMFEYMSKALPRGVNGMPMFTSFQWLNKEEMQKVNEYYQKLNSAI